MSIEKHIFSSKEEPDTDDGYEDCEEFLPVVDRYDNQIMEAPRDSVHHEGSPPWHRSVTAVIYDEAGDILVQKRSDQKERKPGYLEFPGGHVESGESYEKAVARETSEELFDSELYRSPVDTEDFEFRGKIRKESEDNREITGLYVAEYSDGYCPKFDPSGEVENLEFLSEEEILEKKRSGAKLTNSTKRAIEEILEP